MSYHPTALQLQNYIQNKLSDTETEQLELWLADHPEVMEDLEMGEMFKQGIDKDFKFNISYESLYNKIYGWLRPFQFSIGIILGLAIFYIINNNKLNNLDALSSIDVVRVESVRSINETRQVVKYNKKKILLLIPLNFPDSEYYQIKIKNDSGKIMKIDKLIPQSGSELAVIISKDMDIIGMNEIIISNDNNELVSSYKLEFRN